LIFSSSSLASVALKIGAVAFIGFPSWQVAHRVPAIVRRQDYKFAAVDHAR
jgi:hypothetical protein